MPGVLTKKDTKLLDRLTASKALVHDAVTVAELLDIVRRQQEALQIADFKNAALTVAGFGLASAEDIAAKKMPDQLKAECLELRQQHDDAAAYRAQPARPADALKRYQAFYLPDYYPAGGSQDICAEADSLPESLAGIIAADRSQVDEVLDLEAREWLAADALSELNKQVLAAYREKHPPRPLTNEEQNILEVLMVGGDAGPQVFRHDETGQLTRGLIPQPNSTLPLTS